MVDFEEDIKKAVETLQKGGTLLYPTDTVWGLGCDATDENAVNRLFAIKQRPKEKSLIVLLAEARDILKYVATPPPDIITIAGQFDEPTTVIYNGALDLAANAVHENGSIAIRVTEDPFCKALIKRFRKPIISTSANISGAPAPSVFSMVNTQILREVDYVVKYRQNDDAVRSPSRIIYINDDGEMTRIR